MTDKRANLLKSLQCAQELLMRQARQHFKKFVRYLKDDYDMQWFHAVICDKLDRFANGEIKNLMILMPPQHGKSELATRLFPAFVLGKNPDKRIAITSYSDTMASGFNRAIQRNIDNAEYYALFPETKLNNSKVTKTNLDNFSRTEHLFEVVGKKGSVRSVGRGGSLTGNPVDIGIIDDLYKDRVEARSPTISEGAWQWYIDVFKTRLHNDSQQLIMNTRWDDSDLCGRILEEEGDKWVVIKLPAIKTADVNDYDTRAEGEVLWSKKHSLEKILDQKKLSQVSFNSLYQQDPKPNTDILIFSNWIEIPEWPTVDLPDGRKVPMHTDSFGLDFGKTSGINALTRFALNGEDAFFREHLYEAGISAEEIARLLIEVYGYNGEIVYCDHMPTKISALRAKKINAVPAVKGEGSIDDGISKLKALNCHYTADSRNLKKELNNYQWTTYGKVITNIPVDDFNHAIDSCRYAYYSKYFRR